jgi:hypothetical protein
LIFTFLFLQLFDFCLFFSLYLTIRDVHGGAAAMAVAAGSLKIYRSSGRLFKNPSRQQHGSFFSNVAVRLRQRQLFSRDGHLR